MQCYECTRCNLPLIEEDAGPNTQRNAYLTTQTIIMIIRALGLGHLAGTQEPTATDQSVYSSFQFIWSKSTRLSRHASSTWQSNPEKVHKQCVRILPHWGSEDHWPFSQVLYLSPFNTYPLAQTYSSLSPCLKASLYGFLIIPLKTRGGGVQKPRFTAKQRPLSHNNAMLFNNSSRAE